MSFSNLFVYLKSRKFNYKKIDGDLFLYYVIHYDDKHSRHKEILEYARRRIKDEIKNLKLP